MKWKEAIERDRDDVPLFGRSLRLIIRKLEKLDDYLRKFKNRRQMRDERRVEKLLESRGETVRGRRVNGQFIPNKSVFVLDRQGNTVGQCVTKKN